mmetsp:Transcript_413/g.707  ORF Transcript_413/g.707 Transcript_413/m.707 type:complete len:202 (+) Transcript_413:1180-1785(+)
MSALTSTRFKPVSSMYESSHDEGPEKVPEAYTLCREVTATLVSSSLPRSVPPSEPGPIRRTHITWPSLDTLAMNACTKRCFTPVLASVRGVPGTVSCARAALPSSAFSLLLPWWKRAKPKVLPTIYTCPCTESVAPALTFCLLGPVTFAIHWMVPLVLTLITNPFPSALGMLITSVRYRGAPKLLDKLMVWPVMYKASKPL